MLVFEVFLLSMMVVLLLNDNDVPNEGYPAKLENYPIVLKLTCRDCTRVYRMLGDTYILFIVLCLVLM